MTGLELAILISTPPAHSFHVTPYSVKLKWIGWKKKGVCARTLVLRKMTPSVFGFPYLETSPES